MNAVILHTRFWHDDYICQLGIKEKLLFLYFISNEHVNTAGVYELPEIYIRTATRLQPGELKRIKTKFEQAGKFRFMDSWVRIVNYDKYQNFGKSEAQKEGRRRMIEKAPSDIFGVYKLTPSEGVSNPPQGGHIYSNSNSNIINNNKYIKDDNYKEGVVMDDERETIASLAITFLEVWNKMYHTKYKASRPLETNLAYWLEQYSKQDLLQAMANVSKDDFWRDKMTPVILLRQKNPRGERVDYIGELLNLNNGRIQKKGGTATI